MSNRVWFSMKAQVLLALEPLILCFQSTSNKNYCIPNKYTSQAFSIDLGIIWVYDNSMNKKRGRPSKEVERLRNDKLLVRVEMDEKEAFKNAADLAGIPLSSWVRERLRRAAVRELEAASQPIAFFKNFRLE